MKTILGAGVAACFLMSSNAFAAGFSVDCETRAVEKNHSGQTLSTGQESQFHIDAAETSMTLRGYGSESHYKTLKADSNVASYYINANSLKYKMRGPAGSMDISIDRTTGEIYEIVDTKGVFTIIRGRCKASDNSSRF